MMLFDDVELTFADIHRRKAVKTFNIHTTAPIQTTNNPVIHSGGVATFSSNETYSDRFIIWRGIGQKLYLEERSICRTVINGSLCIDFGRTSVVPGTTIIIEKFMLCLVVPTQSGVHRFATKLVPDLMDELNVEIQSLFTQINEKEFLGEYYNTIMLTTPGDVIRAVVLTTLSMTKVTYTLHDGQLVLITLPAKKSEKSEEVVLRDGGFISRMMSSSNSQFVCDVNGILHSSGAFMFYAIHKDGSLKVWTTEGNKSEVSSFIVALNKLMNGVDFDKSNFYIRVENIRGQIIIVVAVECDSNTVFYTFIEQKNRTVTLLSSSASFITGQLIDYRLVFNNESGVQLYGLWKCIDQDVSYRVAQTSIHVAGDNSTFEGWVHAEKTYCLQNDYSKMSIEEIKESLFDLDKRTFDLMYRAVQITCEDFDCEFAPNDWKSLISYVDTFVCGTDKGTSKLCNTGKTKRFSIKESVQQREHKFFTDLASNYDQLDDDSREILSLLIVDVDGASFAGVILRNYSTIIHHSQMHIDQKLKHFLNDLTLQLSEKDEGTRSRNVLLLVGDDIEDMCITLVEQFLSQYTVSELTPVEAGSYPFRGQFTASFVSAIMKQTIFNIIEFAGCMVSFLTIVKNADRDCFTNRKISLVAKLDSLLEGYKFVQAIFAHKIQMKTLPITLGNWIFLANDLSTIRCVGVADTMTTTFGKMNYNQFIRTIVTAALRALWPYISNLVVCRLLAEHYKWNTLYKVCQDYLKLPLFTKNIVISYYLALAYAGSNHPQKALTTFQVCFEGIKNGDIPLQKALRPVTSCLSKSVTPGELYAHVIKFLSDQGHAEEVATLAKCALEELDDEDSFKNRICATRLNLLINSGQWAEALVAIIRNKDVESKKTALVDFINRLLHGEEWKTLISLHYGELEHQVETILLGAARSQEAEATPHLFELLHAYYMTKYRFSKAAHILLEYSYILKQATQTKDLLKKRRDVLATASTVFELMPESDRYTFFPQEQTIQLEFKNDINDSMETEEQMTTPQVVTKRVMYIVDEKNVQSEWSLAKARLLILNDGMTPPIKEDDILKQLLHNKHYDEALDICREFNLDTTDLFFSLTTDVILQDISKSCDWFQLNQRHVETTLSDSWTILRGILLAAKRYWPNDSRPLRAITTALLSHEMNIPCWLQVEYSNFDIADYVRCLVDYNHIATAAECLTEYVQKELNKINDIDVSCILPYAAINDVLQIAASMTDGNKFVTPLKKCLEAYLQRVKAFEKTVFFG